MGYTRKYGSISAYGLEAGKFPELVSWLEYRKHQRMTISRITKYRTDKPQKFVFLKRLLLIVCETA